MLIETAKLFIRSYRSRDIDELLHILSDPVTMSFWPTPYTRDGVKEWIDRSLQSYTGHGVGRYAVVLKETGGIIGDCGVMKSKLAGEPVNDLGYIIHHEYWGKGYATEAASAVKDYAFNTLNLEALHANMPYNHDSSRRVAERIGMKKVSEFYNERNGNIKTLIYAAHRDTAESHI